MQFHSSLKNIRFYIKKKSILIVSIEENKGHNCLLRINEVFMNTRGEYLKQADCRMLNRSRKWKGERNEPFKNATSFDLVWSREISRLN